MGIYLKYNFNNSNNNFYSTKSVECETFGDLNDLDSKFTMFGIGREETSTPSMRLRFNLFPKNITEVSFLDNRNMHLFQRTDKSEQTGLGVSDEQCFDKLVKLFKLVKNDFKDKMITSSNENVEISLYGSILIE